MSKHLTIEDLAKSIANAPKQTPEQRVKSKELDKKTKERLDKEIQEVFQEEQEE